MTGNSRLNGHGWILGLIIPVLGVLATLLIVQVRSSSYLRDCVETNTTEIARVEEREQNHFARVMAELQEQDDDMDEIKQMIRELDK